MNFILKDPPFSVYIKSQIYRIMFGDESDCMNIYVGRHYLADIDGFFYIG